MLATIMLTGFSGACSDETQDKAEDAVESAGDDVQDALSDSAARAQAEAFRGALVAQELDGSGRRDIDTLTDASSALADGTVVGIVDADQDGLDDDGLVQIESSDQAACVRIATDGDVAVTDDPCF